MMQLRQFLLIEKSMGPELSNPPCVGWGARGIESSRKIDSEILPYLTGSINSSIMMLSIAKVIMRTRLGQTACNIRFLTALKCLLCFFLTCFCGKISLYNTLFWNWVKTGKERENISVILTVNSNNNSLIDTLLL